MKSIESVEDFYTRVPKANPLGLTIHNAGAGHFNVFSRANCSTITPYSRRDFYKVSLIIGTGKIHYADKWIYIDKPALLFSNPIIPYSWEAESAIQEGWFCLFTEAFIQTGERKESLQDSPLFSIGSNPVFFIDEIQQKEISDLFVKMTKEISSDYLHRYNLLRNYLHLIIHEAMKMNPTESFEKHTNASSRITSLFMELLERQFPIDTHHLSLKLKTANDYAKSLSIHVNHLNRSVKETTGKTTTEHIAARITREARALLQHTDWNISEIAYGLGFEYPAYFTNFFKKNTGTSPIEIRHMAIS
jgi:AraC family transcriptional activator of pobA